MCGVAAWERSPADDGTDGWKAGLWVRSLAFSGKLVISSLAQRIRFLL